MGGALKIKKYNYKPWASSTNQFPKFILKYLRTQSHLRIYFMNVNEIVGPLLDALALSRCLSTNT